MRLASVAVVLATARVAALVGHDVSWTWWSAPAYLWHDAGVLLLFAALNRSLRRTTVVAWAAYFLVVAYVIVNVPVMRVMSTPMTWTMWRAAGGPLRDSLLVYATVANVVWVLAIVAAASITPVIIQHQERNGRWHAAGISMLTAITAVGPLAASRVDTHGLERNAWSALIVSAMPRVDARAAAADWRQPRRDESGGAGLMRFRGAAAGRNVILVSLESTAAQYLGLYGAQPDIAPNLSVLARSALVFDQAYAVYPESIKGLLSTLCSAYPTFDSPVGVDARRPCASIASILKEAGYHTALFHSGRFAYLGMEAAVHNRGFDILADAGDIGGNHESSFGVDDRSTVRRIVEWIDSVPNGERFFVTYLPIAGHHPYEVPDGTGGGAADEFTRYRNAIRYGDTVLGELMSAIRTRGLEAQTLWVLVGDHGEAFGQHDGNFGHTFQLYEENVHVPFVVAAPGVFPAQLRDARVVSTIDVVPTLIDLLGAPAAAAHAGRSAMDGEPRMALFFADYSLGLLGLRDGRFKYIYEIESGRSRLFDLASDSGETTTLADRDPDAVHLYRQRVRDWIAAQQQLPQ